MSKTSFKQFIFESMSPLFWLLVGYLLNYSIYVLASHILDIKSFGILRYGLTMQSLLITICALGTTSSSLQFLSTYLREHSIKKTFYYISWTLELLHLPLFICLLSAIVVFLIIDPLEFFSGQHLSETTIIMTCLLCSAPICSINKVFNTFLLCANKITLSIISQNISYPILMIIMLMSIKITLAHWPDEVYVTLVAVISSNLLSLLFTSLIIKYYTPRIYQDIVHRLKQPLLLTKMRTWNHATTKQLIQNLLASTMMQIDYISIIFLAKSHEEVAIYGVSLSTILICNIIPKGIFRSLKPMISESFKNKKDLPEFQILWNKKLILNAVILVTTITLIYVKAQSIIMTFYGIKYIEAVPIIHIMSFTLLIMSIAGSKSALLTYSGNVHVVINCYLIRIVSFFVILFFLKSYGVYGAAYSALLSECLRSLTIMTFVNRKLKFKTLGII